MDVKQAQYLMEIEEKRSISKAAESLYISQPALSKYLKQLEEKLGISIFDRDHDMKPTDEGAVYLAYIHRYVADYKQTIEHINNMKNQISGNLYLGIPSVRLDSFFADFMSQFIQQYPSIHVDLIAEPIANILKYLEAGRIDIVCMLPMTENPNLLYTPLISEDLFIVAKPDVVSDIVESDGSISVRNLKEKPFIALKPDFRLRKMTELLLSQYEVKILPVVETESMSFICALVRQGIGVTIATKSQIRSAEPSDNICFYPINEKKINWELGYSVRTGERLGKRYEIFINELRKYLGV